MGTPVNNSTDMLAHIKRAFTKLCRDPNEVEALIIPVRCIENAEKLQRLLPSLPFYEPPLHKGNTLGSFTTTDGANHTGAYTLFPFDVEHALTGENERQLYVIAIRESDVLLPTGRTPAESDIFSRHVDDMKERAENCFEALAYIYADGIYTGLEMLEHADFPSYLRHLITSNIYKVYRAEFGLAIEF